MRVLVTGGAGFLGSHTADAIAAAGHDVRVFDQASPTRASAIQGDLTNDQEVLAAVAEVDAVCHLGAVGDVYLAFERPALAAAVNVVGTANILEAARKCGLRKVVYASTWEVYGHPRYSPLDEAHPTNPDHPYNVTKLAGEQLTLSYDRLKDVPTVRLRLGTAYGTRMRGNAVIPAFVARAAHGDPIVVSGSGKQTRQFTHASDIAAAFVLALQSDVRGEVFNIASDEEISIRELAEAVARRLPTEIMFGEERLGDVPPARVSSRKAADILGWKTHMDFERGLDELIEWQLRRESDPQLIG